MKNRKRKIDILVISDVHLGTYGCHAKELLRYLKSIKPKTVVLNGDIIDIWQFSKNYWPEAHMKVVRKIMKYISEGTPVYYLTGNHDEMLRKFTDISFGSFHLANKLLLNLDNKKAWIFHGNVFDVTMQHSRWLAKLGAVGYDILILINRFFNFFSERVFGKGKLSLSKKIKNSVKSAVSFINNFEQTSADIGIDNKFDFVVCGHIHHPEMKLVTNDKGSITYLNSGDWVENLSALEYANGEWKIYRFNDGDHAQMHLDNAEGEEELNNNQLFENMLQEFNLMKQ